jgi:hypothetical protein
MIEYVNLIKTQYFLCLLIYLLEKLIFKYYKCKDIFQKLFYIKKYDGIHSISILYLIFNIKIYTISYLKNRIIKIYYDQNKISDICIKNEQNITSKNKIILSLVYLDQYYFINILEIYNCGVVYHYTKLFTHIYNYIGERRIEYNILPIISNL